MRSNKMIKLLNYKGGKNYEKIKLVIYMAAKKQSDVMSF